MKRYIIILYIVLFSSCKNSDKNSKKENIKGAIELSQGLNLIDSLSFKIDYDMSYRFITHQIVEKEGQKYLMVGDLNTNGFSILNFDNGNLIKKIKFKATGPNGIASNKAGRNFYYHNKDSIFIFNQTQKSIYLSDENSNIYDKYSLESESNTIGELIVENRFMPSYFNNSLNFCLYPVIPPYKNNSQNFGSIYAEYNIENKKLNMSKLTYDYASKVNRHPIYHYPSRVDDSLRLIFVHPFKSEFKIYDKRKNYFYTKSFNHPYLNEYSPFLESFDQMKKFDVTSTLNNILFFNKTKQLYYVTTELGIPYIDSNTGKENAYEEKPFSVMVFDTQLNVIAQKKFKGGQYLIQNSFVGSKGLYLNTNNPYNPNFNENTYSYHIYSFN